MKGVFLARLSVTRDAQNCSIAMSGDYSDYSVVYCMAIYMGVALQTGV